MAEYENFTEINENFDTIKTLLNSIRAQGILNTSDVDKLLTGINAKLEKINTDEDIDLIKLFLSELKQNLDERHGVLVSKFAAIESLFTNLLKNSSEMPKSADIKELFDIVATNLSVFSREVVSQKDTLTDITLRIDAMRSDDSLKTDIIKNITLLKSDLERLNNGFDTIVISLNDNFKTLAKTISSLDTSEYLDKFANNLSSIEMSSNTVLSALQMLDKKTEKVEDLINNLTTKNDLEYVNKKLFDINASNQEINASISNLYEKQVKFDSIGEKIDASVNIIATLKATLEEADDNRNQQLIEKLNTIQNEILNKATNTSIEDLKLILQKTFEEIFSKSDLAIKNTNIALEDLNKLINTISALEIDVNFKDLFALFGKTESELKQHILDSEQRILALSDANITRVLNDISTNSDSLGAKINSAQSSLAMLSEKNFNSVFSSITELKTLLSQVEENNLSANNAIFSSITDRLTIFEEDLRATLNAQEKSVMESSSQVVEQVDTIKNIASILDYKLDSSVVEIGNVKREFTSLQTAIENVLALDFVSVVKDFRVDLYATKQEMINSVENSETVISEKFTNDLYSKYELLISKLDSVEDELQKNQLNSLNELKNILDKISASIIDVLSYVSEAKNSNIDEIEEQIKTITEALKEQDINYIESVRDIVDSARAQVDSQLKTLEDTSAQHYDNLKRVVSENVEDVKKDLKYSYNKLLEIQDSYTDLKEQLNVNNFSVKEKLDFITESTSGIKSEFDSKIAAIKLALIERLDEFKQEYTCENADKISEFKFISENLQNKNLETLSNLITEQKELIQALSQESSNARIDALDKISDNFISVKDFLETLNSKSSELLISKVSLLLENFNTMKETLDKVDENVDGDMTRQMSIIESNFESLVSQISILFDKSEIGLATRINNEFESISARMQEIVTEKLDAYKNKIENSFDNIEKKNNSNAEYLQERIVNLNSLLKEILDEQASESKKQLEEISVNLKDIIDNNNQSAVIETGEIKEKLVSFSKSIECSLEELKSNLETGLSSTRSLMAEEINSNYEKTEEIITSKLNNIQKISNELLTNQTSTIEEFVSNISEQVELQKQSIQIAKDLIIDSLKEEMLLNSKNIEKETDIIVAEIIEQFELLKSSQNDEIISLTSKIEEIVTSHIYENIEDLKSYLDIKTDNSTLTTKLDNLKLELSNSFSNIVEDLNKLLDAGVFTSTMSDYRLANEVLVNSAIDKLNDKIEAFISENIVTITDAFSLSEKSFEDKLSIFNNSLKEAIVDKYEEIKLLSNNQNSSLLEIQNSILDIFRDFDNVKSSIEEKIDSLRQSLDLANESTTKGLEELIKNFDNLRSQISNKSFDEAFQASINKQIGSLESLISEQLGYIEDISDLCSTNLPDVTELNTLVKGSILESIHDFSEKLDSLDFEDAIDRSVKELKSDIITQFINIFNQISFATEQEEILDFIQDKHDELITILSHIVTTTEEISQVKDSVALLNEKINSIISSDSDIDYIYSLHDLESDIANLRLALNEMRDSNQSVEISNLLQSTEDIYKLLESVQSELPRHSDFEDLTEDVESISSRTNKLLLASDESYKTLQDNLQEFKLVINDLDERTRNFAQESGMDRLDAKLNAINSMMLSGAKTNQVFNQVFEYLAEWVDNASTQINSISTKVDSLDEISQIKTMITDMKAQEDVESAELVDALGVVFNKQTKKISSLEKKLDKIIVETTINNKSIDLSPMEDTLNKFLVAMDEKFTAQQDKINLLESKLETVMSLLDDKESAQLSKKVGGMDRQIAKLNKSIEKIASHVIEK